MPLDHDRKRKTTDSVIRTLVAFTAACVAGWFLFATFILGTKSWP